MLLVPAVPLSWCDPVEKDSVLSCLSDSSGGAQGVKTVHPNRLLWEMIMH